MKLRIHDNNNIVGMEFGFWLLQRIKMRLISNIRKYNLVNWNNYFTESSSVKRLYNKDYSAEDIVVFAAQHLSCSGTYGDIIISISNTQFVPGYDRLKLSVAVKTLNYGTLDVKGCPIFTDTFNYFAENIDTYVGLFYGM